MSAALEEMLRTRADVWRARTGLVGAEGVATGHPALDTILPEGGWPQGALTEILCDQLGIGELGLLMPALARLAEKGRWIAWIAPPYLPYAPALAAAGLDPGKVLLVRPRATTDGLWALEQALRSGTCGAVLAWPAAGTPRQLRRLQLAAEAGCCWGVLFRPASYAAQASPAALRLRLEASADALAVQVLKRRGGWAQTTVRLERAFTH